MKPQAGTDHQVMTPDAVAQWLHVKPRQLARFGIPSVVLGHKTTRYLRDDVLEFLQQQRRLPNP